MSKIIGIDLGTTTSCVSVSEGGYPAVIKAGSSSSNGKVMPSIVAYTTDNRVRVGEYAKRQTIINPTRTISSIKRFIGRTYDEVIEETARVPYQVDRKENGEIAIKIGEKELAPQQVSSEILKKLKSISEDYLNQEVNDAVITVPAYFTLKQKQATKEAAAIAGLNVRDILNEPTAAALAYGLKDKYSGKIAVFDLGGGTFDISILDCGKGIYEVLSTCGDTQLGGDDLDHLLMDEVIRKFDQKNGTDIRKDPKALQSIKEAAEKAKIDLDTDSSASIILPNITEKDGKPLHLEMEIEREEFENLCKPVLYRCLPLCEKALEDKGLLVSDIDQILLVGASTNMPLVRKMVRQFFHKDPSYVENPEEMVAKGAAIQGAIINGELHGNVLMDIFPLALGVLARKESGKKLEPCWIIMNNSTLPTRCESSFSTVTERQKAVDIRIIQGTGPEDLSPIEIGSIHMGTLFEDSADKPVIHVIFDIDIKGIITVTAKNASSGELLKIPIHIKGELSTQELNAMRQDGLLSDQCAMETEWLQSIQRAEERISNIRDAIDDKTCPLPPSSVNTIHSLLLQYDEYKKRRNSEIIKILESRILAIWNESNNLSIDQKLST